MWPYVAALASALLMWAAFPPLDAGTLAFVAPAPWLWGLRRAERSGVAVRASFVFGCGFFGVLMWWIRAVGIEAWVLLTLWLASTAVAYGLVVWAVRLWPAWRWWLVVVGGWALWELVRARFPFGGFPWGSLGYAAAGAPGGLGAVQWFGAAGWTVLAVAVSTGLVLVAEDPQRWRLVVDPAVIVFLLLLAGSLVPPRADGERLRVAIVQGNSPCAGVHCQNESLRRYQAHLLLTRSLRPGAVDLVVWPQDSTGTPFEPVGNEEVRSAIAGEAARLETHILVGGTRFEGEERFLRVNTLFAPEGDIVGEYAKRRAAPFGEAVVLRGTLGFVPQLDGSFRDLTPGERAAAFRLSGGIAGTLIAEEAAFGRTVRSMVGAGAELLVVTSNQSAFGRGAAASDHLIAMARVNAAGAGMDLVLAATTGTSTFIAADGSIGERTERFVESILQAEVGFRTAGRTLWARFGDWLLYLAIAAGVLGLALPGEARTEARRRLASA